MRLRRTHTIIAIGASLLLHGSAAAVMTLDFNAEIEPPEKKLKIVISKARVHAGKETAPEPPKPVAPKKPEPPKKKEVVKKAKPIPKKVPIPKPQKEVVARNPTPPLQPKTAVVDTTVRANYEQVLLHWLEKQKRYPKAARMRRLEGESVIRIRIDRTGAVRAFEIVEPTGTSILDRAISKMVERADPFPPFPSNYPGNALEFAVPISFRLADVRR